MGYSFLIYLAAWSNPIWIGLYIIAILIISGVMVAQHKSLQSYKEKNKDLANRCVEMEKDLELYKTLISRLKKGQNLVVKDIHDNVGNRLAGVNNLSEILLDYYDRGKSEELVEVYESLVSATSGLSEEIREIYWASTENHNKLEEVVKRLDWYISDYETRHENVKIALYTENDKNYELPLFWNRQILLILKDAIKIAAEFSNSSRIRINIRAENNFLCIRCNDQGVEFGMEDEARTWEYSKLKDKVKSLEFDFKVKSKIGKGTDVILKGKI